MNLRGSSALNAPEGDILAILREAAGVTVSKSEKRPTWVVDNALKAMTYGDWDAAFDRVSEVYAAHADELAAVPETPYAEWSDLQKHIRR